MSDPTSVEWAWARLSIHLEWASDFWLLFVFTDDPRANQQLRERAQSQLEAGGRQLVNLRPSAPDDTAVRDVLLQGRADQVAWVDYVRHDAPGQADWREAWQRLCAQLNERRELLRRRWGTGGIVFATTLDRLDATPAVAPDLWTVRALLLRVATRSTDPSDRPSFERIEDHRRKSTRDLELDRQAVERARRKLADGGPLADLALALRTLSETLDDLREPDEALAAGQEAVEHYRTLAREEPEAYSSRLAAALSDLGARLFAVRQRDEALAAAEEAVELLRRLAHTEPET
ncbi:tetratricopeptide repeat protein [Enhygromyxa salina]|uniref:Tetratricopeptide repeat protein n=1 Tax=Enhygromyxa salina TaxID=215803 RepID=A0A2S9XWU4_9BACT|nr:tetratricopeptide repeat protein [Enhygromyxa salina]PRP97313.1 hypothetical protein ENSA7_66630 [Enhygromyxa salina]